MPGIDVTGILLDPDIAGTPFTVIRRSEIVSNFGLSTVRSKSIPNVRGSVQPTGENSLVREAAFDVQAKTIKVITTFRLRGVSTQAGANYKPDLILWNGDYYEVRVINDYSQFGGGFIDAECTSIDYVDQAPNASPTYVGRMDFSNTANSGWAKGTSC